MTEYTLRFAKLIFGLLLYSLGIAVTLAADIGYAPWEVFHVGLSRVFGVSVGTASIAAGMVIVVLAAALGEKLGIGTLLNMLLIGLFLDLIIWLGFVPYSGGMLTGILELITGLYIIASATYFYVDSGFGAGPRDSLMVALSRRTGLAPGVCKAIIETAAVAIGWFFGGMVGVGTIISVFAGGFCVQTAFRLFRFNPAGIKHESAKDSYDKLRTLIKGEGCADDETEDTRVG